MVPGRPCVLLLFFLNARSPRSVGRSPWNFATCSEACSIYKCWSKSLGVYPPKRKIWGRKNAKFCTISDTFPLWARISLKRMEISKIWKIVHYSVPSRVQPIKVGELWSTNHGDLEVQLYRENWIFWNTIFLPLGGAAPRNFYTHYKISKSC